MVNEIQFRRFISSRSAPVSYAGVELTSEEVGTSKDIIAEIDRCVAAGARVVLLRMTDCAGGHVRAAFEIVDKIREVSESGTPVVAFVETRAASMAPVIVAACDLAVMAPQANLVVHSALGEPESVREVNRATIAFLEARTAVPRADLELWLTLRDGTDGPNFAELAPEIAVSHGFVDLVGDLDTARAVASLAGSGQIFRTPRQELLRERCGHHGRPPFPVVDAIGAKLDHKGTALKVASANLQVGGTNIADMFQSFSHTVEAGSSYFGHVFETGHSFGTAAYTVVSACSGSTGSLGFDHMCRQVAAISRSATGFTVYLGAAVPTGTTVSFRSTVIYIP